LHDQTYVDSTFKQINYPAVRSIRKEIKERKKKEKKIIWLKKMYGFMSASGKRKKHSLGSSLSGTSACESDPQEEDLESILKWSASLDYERYVDNWMELATTNSTWQSANRYSREQEEESELTQSTIVAHAYDSINDCREIQGPQKEEEGLPNDVPPGQSESFKCSAPSVHDVSTKSSIKSLEVPPALPIDDQLLKKLSANSLDANALENSDGIESGKISSRISSAQSRKSIDLDTLLN
jgi:hypothetical protein